jgi:hypothetical protein
LAFVPNGRKKAIFCQLNPILIIACHTDAVLQTYQTSALVSLLCFRPGIMTVSEVNSVPVVSRGPHVALSWVRLPAAFQTVSSVHGVKRPEREASQWQEWRCC